MNTKNNSNTGNKGKKTLKALIKGAKTSQRQLSKDTNIAEVTINTWTAGRKIPRFDNAAVLAAELNISLRTLARAMNINVSEIPGDYDLSDLKKLASDLGIDRVEDLPEDYQTLKKKED